MHALAVATRVSSRRALAAYSRGRFVSFLRVRQLGSRAPAASDESSMALEERALDQLPGYVSYRSDFLPSMRLKEFVSRFQGLEANARATEHDVRLCGRVSRIRRASSKLVFVDIVAEDTAVQVLASRSSFEDSSGDGDSAAQFRRVMTAVRRGDVLGVNGFPGKSGTGELSVIPRSMHILSPCWRNLPLKATDTEIRYRHRHVDLLVNRERTRRIFHTRAIVQQTIRRVLVENDFLEVETPILASSSGGALARPFDTYCQALDTSLRLRIAPELFLKQLVIGGIDRVFELGKVFRNEGVDLSHNPEFTTCEFYEAYASLDGLMARTEQLLLEIMQAVSGSAILHVSREQVERNTGKQLTPSMDSVTIDFSRPFHRVSIPGALEAIVGEPLPDANDPASAPAWEALLARHGVALPSPATPARMLDKAIGHFLEPLCVTPTFLCDHPVALSPLAKSYDENPGLTQRFELFVAGQEICNAYVELNDPAEQRRRFHAQQVSREGAGDDEAHEMDEAFCEALEYGLPPTGGWGMGIDRLVMLLTGESNIREVLLFPMLRPRRSPAKQ